MEDLVHAQSYDNVLARLNRASVKKHADAYVDIPWDDAAFAIDARDPRWQLPADTLFGDNAWYRSQSALERSRIGLAVLAHQTKRGAEFENVLSRGLLGFAHNCPNGSQEFRYAYHELIEEGQHTLMFQEFVNRSGCDPRPLRGVDKWLSEAVPRQARVFPELFFVYVLAGEVPIDQTQRAQLRLGDALHPLQRRIMQIHVSEEARHVCFAHKYLDTHLAQLSTLRKLHIQLFTPFIVAKTARLMLRPPASFTRPLGVPDQVMQELFRSEHYHALFSAAVRPLCDTFAELGLISAVNAPLFELLDLGAREPSRKALPSNSRLTLSK